jgi:hypothetical protein
MRKGFDMERIPTMKHEIEAIEIAFNDGLISRSEADSAIKRIRTEPYLFISVDVEVDGPIPGPHNMLSLGAVAFTIHKGNYKELDTFEVNLELLPESEPMDPSTAKFWKDNQAAYDATRVNTKAPKKAMEDFVKWMETFGRKPTFISYPAGLDFTFVYWYLMRYMKKSPFSFSALDVKTFAWATMGGAYHYAIKPNMPKKWFEGCGEHPHVVIEDAREQAILFTNILKDVK